jgi:uncharacterized protein DUF6788
MHSQSSNQLQACTERLHHLAAQLADTGFTCPGTLVHRYVPCGKPGCRCKADPPQLHGPYWDWSRSVGGRTVSRRLSEPQARLYQEWIANRHRLLDILAEIDQVSAQAAEILLAQADQAEPPQATA